MSMADLGDQAHLITARMSQKIGIYCKNHAKKERKSWLSTYSAFHLSNRQTDLNILSFSAVYLLPHRSDLLSMKLSLDSAPTNLPLNDISFIYFSLLLYKPPISFILRQQKSPLLYFLSSSEVELVMSYLDLPDA